MVIMVRGESGDGGGGVDVLLVPTISTQGYQAFLKTRNEVAMIRFV